MSKINEILTNKDYWIAVLAANEGRKEEYLDFLTTVGVLTKRDVDGVTKYRKTHVGEEFFKFMVDNTKAITVPEDPNNPGHDVLGAGLKSLNHQINNAVFQLGDASVPDIARLARRLAEEAGLSLNPNSLSNSAVRAHLVNMRKKS